MKKVNDIELEGVNMIFWGILVTENGVYSKLSGRKIDKAMIARINYHRKIYSNDKIFHSKKKVPELNNPSFLKKCEINLAPLFYLVDTENSKVRARVSEMELSRVSPDCYDHREYVSKMKKL